MPAPEFSSVSMRCVRMEDRAGIAARAFMFARRMGFDQRACWEIGIVVQELASNMVRHGGGGNLELHAGGGSLEVIAVDLGPGIPKPVLQARESWARGLGAVRRFMHDLEISSANPEAAPQQSAADDIKILPGTRILARRYLERGL